MANPVKRTWKAVEKRLCAKLLGKNTFMSGRNGGEGTSGDYVSMVPGRKWLYVEIKHRAAAAIFTLWADTVRKANLERRRPVVVMHKTGERTAIAVVDFDFFCYLLDKADGKGMEADV